MPSAPPKTVYFAGELFDAKHLIGNALLAESLFEISRGAYVPVVPQNIEARRRDAHEIRDSDILTLLDCDLAVFQFDGHELDSGTVVEFMFAKFADIPAVVLRTDFRKAGDQRVDPWNLMCSFYPRTVTLKIHSMSGFKKHFAPYQGRGHLHHSAQGHGSSAALAMVRDTAHALKGALARAARLKPTLPKRLRPSVAQWLSLMPGYKKSSRTSAAKWVEKFNRLSPPS
ncbi:MAG: nucleoside 2-deoxyribosyltransferase [Verrucomicrobiae bacterium]|nr:nucleoside 2-deoxyribosyltransferase [Verrucomicrobiae bacterium]